uniref:Vta1/callose synthase N-terminal domain-containing protein n=1 Tax=Calcidiscus leptoporus TaxID=127549 RepID=A0A7S0NUH5_9EUKA|mmetsp:Transcript_24092/g.55905  ORF Transcript_24092/g.55905 Transcript_24092/m.55905 type:complete len:332 (+) Transcript_24092:165-1160(+)
MELPISLKPVKPYLDRAAELKQKDPIVSYHCGFYALQEAMKLRANLPKADMGFVLSLMERLEQEKAQLPEIDDAAVHIENFGQELFMRADDADRAGRSNLNTGKAFLAAANVLETCKQFGDLPADLAEKVKYAKFRFVEIAKATKEGRAAAPPRGTEPSEPSEPSRASADETPPPAYGGPAMTAMPPPPDAGAYMSLPPADPAQGGLPSYMGLPPAAPPCAGVPPTVAPVSSPWLGNVGLPPPPSAQPPQPAPHPVSVVQAGRQASNAIVIPAPPPGFKVERAQLLEASRLCQSSMNALQFQDAETAIHQLTQALLMLTQPPTASAPEVPE